MPTPRAIAEEIDSETRRGFTPSTERNKNGVDEYWETDAELSAEMQKQGGKWTGDCDAFATRARNLAMSRGVKSRYLHVIVPSGESHLVTLIDDQWVVDNLTQKVYHYTDMPRMGYEPLRGSSDQPGGQWRMVDQKAYERIAGVVRPEVPYKGLSPEAMSNPLRRQRS